MTGLALVLAMGALWGGISLIRSGTKSVKAITFPTSFYEDLRYFKVDKHRVIAVKGDESTEEIFEGTVSTATKYFSQVQKGFEEWLETHDHFDTTDSKVTFN